MRQRTAIESKCKSHESNAELLRLGGGQSRRVTAHLAPAKQGTRTQQDLVESKVETRMERRRVESEVIYVWDGWWRLLSKS